MIWAIPTSLELKLLEKDKTSKRIRDVSLIVVVGSGMRGIKGIAGRVFFFHSQRKMSML
ncbi:MAG: hypothetical protein P0116_02305 [Candidatus Nitrosocosmicus sp.]|nr:hypothetical protein [Candidatus Nitrosocosmicus sp.]